MRQARLVRSKRVHRYRAAQAESLIAVITTYSIHIRSYTTFVGTVCAMLARGAALFIDYGFPRHEYYHRQRAQGTLMCHYRHRAHGDPFVYPGLQDITAHVEFSAVYEAGVGAGAELLGYTSQARFLLNAGITDVLAEIDPSDAQRFLPAANAVQKLISEAEMGELFKVIAFSRGIDGTLDAFARGDRSHTL
ncbi:S-adenosyl-L-methionine-dependent methyltransferase family protein [Burkholderia pseudomallei]|nr:S-adenosyl-L-methionine-dependent methyltransferase family protein [Burkholderia pseudomallei]